MILFWVLTIWGFIILFYFIFVRREGRVVGQERGEAATQKRRAG